MSKKPRCLITGGSGSLGMYAVPKLLDLGYEVTVFSRDEEKQLVMQRKYEDQVSFIIGNIRDYRTVYSAMEDVDLVLHAAALKIIPVCEANILESVKTNLLGTINVKNAAVEHYVPISVFLNTDKSVYPINVYGACKMLAEKYWVDCDFEHTVFCSVRYGNVVGSRGSVIPYFKELISQGFALRVTHPEMTRFFISMEQAWSLIIAAIENRVGGIYVPKLKSCLITRLARLMGGEDYPVEIMGIRPGEKIHETLINEEEFRRTQEYSSFYLIQSIFGQYYGVVGNQYDSYSAERLSDEEIKEMIK